MKLKPKATEKRRMSRAPKRRVVPTVFDVKEAHFQPSENMELIPANELVTLSVLPRKKHWAEFIKSNQTGMIFGERGRGKTWFAMGLALSMSCRVEFLGHKPNKARRVIYLDGEMDLVTFQQRMLQICNSLGVEPPANLRVFTPEAFTDLLPSINTLDGQKVIDKLIGTAWEILIVDNYSAWSSDGRETAEAWAPFMRWMLGHKRAGRTVIVIHHSGKAGKQRGSSKHEDALDWSINLISDKQSPQYGALRFSLVWEKARHLASDKITPIAVTMQRGEDGTLVWGYQHGVHKDPKIVKAEKLKAEGATNTQIAQTLDVDRTTVGRWLKAA
jgi:putative DNA primase/helicase